MSVSVILGAIYVFQQMVLTSDYFNYRLEMTYEGDSSGRDLLYDNYIKFVFSQSNIIHLLFGNGADATVRILGEYAHNDWLEMAINNGLVAVFLFLLYWIVMLKAIIKTRKVNSICYLMMGTFFIIYLMKSFYSMSYNSTSIFASSAFGFALANSNRTEMVIQPDNDK